MLEVPLTFSSGCQISFKRWKNILIRDLPLSRYSRTVEPHTSSLWARAPDKIALTRGVTKCECHQAKTPPWSPERSVWPEQNTRKAPVQITHAKACVWWHSHFVTPRVSAILSATRAHKLDVCGSTVREYREKGRSRVRIFFHRLNDIWNPRKISEGLLTCLIILVKIIWRSDQLNGIYRASSEGHRDFLSRL